MTPYEEAYLRTTKLLDFLACFKFKSVWSDVEDYDHIPHFLTRYGYQVKSETI